MDLCRRGVSRRCRGCLSGCWMRCGEERAGEQQDEQRGRAGELHFAGARNCPSHSTVFGGKGDNTNRAKRGGRFGGESERKYLSIHLTMEPEAD